VLENYIQNEEIHNASDNLRNTDVGPVGTNVGCNTVHGFGQDVERAGEKTQDAADAVKKKL